MKINQAIREATTQLSAAGIDSAAVDARLLMRYLLAETGLYNAAPGTGADPMPRVAVDPGALFMRADDPAPSAYADWVARRVAREPLQHIVGSAPFCGLDLFVEPGCFVPRPETELLADWAAHFLTGRPTPHVVDLCCGPGTLGLGVSFLYDAPISLTGFEISPAALRLAEKNARLVPQVNATFVQADLAVDDPLEPPATRDVSPGAFAPADVVVCNPPYVPESTEISPEVAADPHAAVFSGDDGLDLMPRVLQWAEALGRAGGGVGIEHDDSNGAQVAAMMQQRGWRDITQHRDLAGRPRFVTALLPQ
ncbi:HemK/PrmC family methyltransferase [Corynebacterium jeikeium]|uniref:N5-glutamine methyltransferase family protein n=1 Tax=Corynebacterium jeikeium TaxID=38289 RepID=UPI0001B719CA|nr:HemK/PrmC family methyltransferase [Corynebacterium jeikeium]EEW17525.1 methyltransferase, HemK family [Corynebacterium jeikeium ATCC 43734]OOD32169.1 SAM-dependent methyltransferase [Corynebacterium jeikeium]WCZ53959.1 Release factor glutamine methyltransferase [Corynebacterium jeikeium]SUY80737.1 methylase of peptide chain release factors [Corynebacterium jeikeium]